MIFGREDNLLVSFSGKYVFSESGECIFGCLGRLFVKVFFSNEMIEKDKNGFFIVENVLIFGIMG